MSKELNRMQKLAGVPAKKETESLNEHYMAGGIVGVGAINQIPPREKSDYEMAFEHFMTEGEEKVEETSCGSYEEDDTTMEEGMYEEDDTMEEAVGIAATPEAIRGEIQKLIKKFEFDEDLGAAVRSKFSSTGTSIEEIYDLSQEKINLMKRDMEDALKAGKEGIKDFIKSFKK